MQYHLYGKQSWIARAIHYPLLQLLTGALFLALLAKITIQLPFTPVPITFQTLGVYCIGLALSPACAMGSVVTYVLSGMFLPVFSGSSYGIGALLGPTAGYLLALPFAAALISIVYRKKQNMHGAVLSGMLLSVACMILVCGSVGVSCSLYALGVTPHLDLIHGFKLGLLPFLIGEVIKVSLVIQGRAAVYFFSKR